MAQHTWRFFRAGGFDQVRLASGADLVNLEQLDLKLWLALACPTKGLEFDSRTLELLDTDKDGRIRPPELVAASKWLGSVLVSPDDLSQGKGSVRLSNLAASEEAGRLAAAAKDVLASRDHAGAEDISITDVVEAVKKFDARPFNGDGVVPPESAHDDVVAQAARELIDCVGGEPDRSGKPGFTAARLESFYEELTAHAAWLGKGEADPATLVLRAATADAYAALSAVRSKVDDYFARCRVAAFDARAVAALNRDEKDYQAAVSPELSASASQLAAFPLSKVEANRALPLHGGLNPAWAAPMAALVAKVLKPLLHDRPELSESDWAQVCQRFEPFEKWQAGKAGVKVDKLGAARVRALLEPGVRPKLEALLADEKRQEPIAQALTSLERLVHYHRHLFTFANNFVSFSDFYERRGPAMFQVGTLILDRRECLLCLRVDDAAKSAAMVPLARTFVAYCDLSRPASSEKMSVVAAFTAGDNDSLMVGRNGVFFDRGGRDWDATVTKIIDAPISVRQAFWSPYKKAIRFVDEQIAKRAASAEAASTERLTGAAKDVEKAADGGHAAVTPPKKIDIGTVAALGVAVGGITAALGALLHALFGLGWWIPLGLVGLVLAISGPSMLIATLKLRQRNLGPLLDANGWALNAPARINVPFGGSLTRVAVLPKGSTRDLSDPFAEKHRPWGVWVAVFVALLLGGAWYLGKLDGVLPMSARSITVLGEKAPAYQPPAASQTKPLVP